MRTDGQKNVAKLIVAFFGNFVKAPKNSDCIAPLRGFVAIVGMIKTNSLSSLKAKQTTVELAALLFVLNLCSATGRPLLRNSFLLVYELRTATLISRSMSYYCVFPLKSFPPYCQRRICIYT
jgi:hypothetical protein